MHNRFTAIITTRFILDLREICDQGAFDSEIESMVMSRLHFMQRSVENLGAPLRGFAWEDDDHDASSRERSEDNLCEVAERTRKPISFD